MTWVFGNANILGSAICVADIQVTLQDGRTFDCVQKLHELDRNVLAGFAGDVLTGFAMLVSLNRYLLGQDAPIEIERVFDTLPGHREKRLRPGARCESGTGFRNPYRRRFGGRQCDVRKPRAGRTVRFA